MAEAIVLLLQIRILLGTQQPVRLRAHLVVLSLHLTLLLAVEVLVDSAILVANPAEAVLPETVLALIYGILIMSADARLHQYNEDSVVFLIPTKPKPVGLLILANPPLTFMPELAILPVQAKHPVQELTPVSYEGCIKPAVTQMVQWTVLVMEANLPVPALPGLPLCFVG